MQHVRITNLFTSKDDYINIRRGTSLVHQRIGKLLAGASMDVEVVRSGIQANGFEWLLFKSDDYPSGACIATRSAWKDFLSVVDIADDSTQLIYEDYQDKQAVQLRVLSTGGFTIASVPQVDDDSLSRRVLGWRGVMLDHDKEEGFGDGKPTKLLPLSYRWINALSKSDWISVRGVEITFDDGTMVSAAFEAEQGNEETIWINADHTHDLSHDSNPHPNLGAFTTSYSDVVDVLDVLMAQSTQAAVKAVMI